MLRVALVGSCGVAAAYRCAYRQIPGVEWKLAVDTNMEKNQKCLKEGCERISDRFEDALAGDIDVVDVWTPNHLHEEQVCRALEAGKHVMVQKPITPDLPGADRILAVEKKSKGTLGVYMTYYDNPLVWDLKKMIDAGALGQIQSVRARNAYPFLRHNVLGPGNWRASVEKVGGGSFVQLSIHSINLLQWMIGKPITEVMAYSANQFAQGMVGGDDVTLACVRFGQDEKAPLGIFDSAYSSDGRGYEIYGTSGFVKVISDGEVELLFHDRPTAFGNPAIDNMPLGEPIRIRRSQPFGGNGSTPCNQHRMFFEALRDGKKPHMSAAAARHDLAICQAAYQSSKDRRAIPVTPVA